MCFAPRYISGPIARPCTDCRNTASLPVTPWASRVDVKTTKTAVARSAAALAPLVFEMTGVAGLIELLARLEDLHRALLLGRAQRERGGVDHRARDLRPVAF